MENVIFVIKSFVTQGNAPQSFLGAKWILFILKLCPQSRKRQLALWTLGNSPHYFYRNLDQNYDNVSHSEFLEAEHLRNTASRERIYEDVLRQFIRPNSMVLDYGCGPGYLAKAASKYASRVFALDVSDGAIECAKIINFSDKIHYMTPIDFESIVADSSIDFIYSTAVIQHMTNDVFEKMLNQCFRKLKPAGMVLLHVQLEGDGWKSEEEWKSDNSIAGKIKLSYGLNCFSRSEKYFEDTVAHSGFSNCKIDSMMDYVKEPFDDVCRQHLLTAVKPA